MTTLMQAAMDGANGIDIDGRNIRVAFASEKPQGAFKCFYRSSFCNMLFCSAHTRVSGGGGGGGYGGGGGGGGGYGGGGRDRRDGGGGGYGGGGDRRGDDRHGA
jgi:hypothetical protein